MKVLFILEEGFMTRRLGNTGWIKTYIKTLTEELSKKKVKVKFDENHDCDLIHIHIPLLNCLKYFLFKKKPIILHGHTSHNSLKYDNWGYLKKRFFKLYFGLLSRKANLIIAPSKSAKKELEKICHSEIVVVSNGVNLNRFRYEKKKRISFRKKYGITEDEFVLLFVGRTDKRKGFDFLCEVVKNLKDTRLVVCGTRQGKLPDNTIFTGFIDNIQNAYCGCDVFISLSKHETQGLTILEAAACKRPLVLSDLSVFKEWLIPNKDCVMSNDLNTLVTKITLLKNNKNIRKRFGNNSYKKVKENHNISRVVDELVSAYESVLE